MKFAMTRRRNRGSSGRRSTRWLKQRPLLLALVAAALVTLGAGSAGIGSDGPEDRTGSSSGAPAGAPPMADSGRSFPRPARVAVMVLENRSYEEVIGSASAPYINGLARRYALGTRYYAIAHPSLPNYIALTGGSVFGIKNDCSICDVNGRNIVGQLDRTGHTWKAYFEALDSNRRPGPTTDDYNPHYNPFVYYETVRGVPHNRDRVVDFDTLRRDLKRGPMADFAWIAPGVHHDGHNSSLRAADRYASRLVPQVLKALGPRGILYLTWDEGSPHDRRGVGGSGGGRIALIAAGGAARRHTRTAMRADHYALLRTLEAGFGLRTLGKAGDSSTPLLRGLVDGAAGLE
jgi:phosphatidylinositol-3-phosphatase